MKRFKGWKRISFVENEKKQDEKDHYTGEMLKLPYLKLILIDKANSEIIDKEVLCFNKETTPVNLRSYWNNYEASREKAIESIKSKIKQYGIKRSEL